ITDTHFSPAKPHFNGNWSPLLTWIEETGSDLIVHTGDLTVDGADKDADMLPKLIQVADGLDSMATTIAETEDGAEVMGRAARLIRATEGML
ncbi:hypothetical protein ACC687_38705, partial [Rhizobium ruizarguesonis]